MPETYRSDDELGPEVFCSDCLAGVESSQHYEMCICRSADHDEARRP